MLHPANGPPCPDCGCRDSEVFRAAAGGWWGLGQAHCRHCGKCFSFVKEAPPASAKERAADAPPDPNRALVRRRLRCPRCGSVRIMTHTVKPQRNAAGERIDDGRITRYHRCLDCKRAGKPKREYNFKSIEE